MGIRSFISKLFGGEQKPRSEAGSDSQKPRRHRKDGRSPSRSRSKSSSRPERKPTPELPKKRFSELGLEPRLVEILESNDFMHATTVQERSIPHSLAGKNVFCSSETGSGKTLSFLLPMIQKFHQNEIDQALIICPTREIAIQIQKVLQMFNDESLKSALVIGGTDMREQEKSLSAYPNILVATPGRLLDMLNSGKIWLQYFNYVVLDEADRMLDMGFEEDLIAIHNELSGDHQTLLFSATLFPEIKKIAKRYAAEYEEIIIGKPTSIAKSVTHVLVELPNDQKVRAMRFLMSRNKGKMMVFFNTIRETSDYNQTLERQNIQRVNCIHSQCDQSTRERIINEFRTPDLNVLLCTDVAARGIDIPNVELVVNFELPNNAEEYIHRVGRTGRAGKKGVAVSFYSAKDKPKLEAIEKLIKGKIRKINDVRDVFNTSRSRRSSSKPRNRKPTT